MKKLLLILSILLICSKAEAATLYAKAAGGNWSAAGTWSNVNSAGVDNSGPPLATDAVIFDSGSDGTVTVDTTTCVAATLVGQAGSTGTLVFTASQKLTVTTTFTLVTGMATSGTGTLQLSNTATITSGGVTISGSVIFNGGTWTLADNWAVTGNVTVIGTVANTLNSNTLSIAGSLGISDTGDLLGTTSIVMNGTGFLSSNSSSSVIQNNLTIDTAGTITFSAIVAYTNGTFTYTAGTVDTTTNNSMFLIRDCTLNTNGINFYNIYIGNYMSTITLGSNLACTNNLTLGVPSNSGSGAYTILGAYNISCSNFILDFSESATATPSRVRTFIMPASQTLTVTNSIVMEGMPGFLCGVALESGTASTAFNFNYSGSQANARIYYATFTDVDASGGNPIYNWFGNTLTRTTNITNVTSADIGGGGGGAGFFTMGN